MINTGCDVSKCSEPCSGQAAQVRSLFTRPVGGALPVAVVSFFWMQVGAL